MTNDRRYSDTGPEAPDQDLKTRIAWLYHMEDMTQEAIAERLGITRIRVVKLLAHCRRDGTVQVRVTGKLSDCMALERDLEARFPIGEAIVIPTPDDESKTSSLIGMRLGALVDTMLHDSMTVSMGWGETLRASLGAMTSRSLKDFSVVSLLGGLTRASGLNPSEMAWRFADLFGGDCYMLAAPVYAPDESTRAALFAHKGLSEVMQRARAADLSIVSVGDFSPTSTIFRYRMLEPSDLEALSKAGAVCDVLCHFLDRDGRLVDHPANRRVMAMNPAELVHAPRLVLASGGKHKVEGMLAMLKTVKPSWLITDHNTARGMLASKPSS